MLCRLSIKNYALIDQLVLDFEKGFTVITGETGSGKSILLGAMGLILGNRADSSVVHQSSKKCVVEGEFDIASYGLQSLFDQEDLDYAERSILRREILESGRSRAFINDTPVSVQLLKNIGDKLVDIHSQHDVLMLKNNSIQLHALDAFAKNEKIKDAYRTCFLAWQKLDKQYIDLSQSIAQSNMDKDYIDFQLAELQDCQLKIGEKEKLEAEQKRAENSELIKTILSQTTDILSSDQHGMIPLAIAAENTLSKIANDADEYANLLDRIKSVRLELNDLHNDLEQEEIRVDIDPRSLDTITARLDTLYRIETKHRVNSTEELLEIEEKLSDSIFEAERLEKQLKTIEKERDDTQQQLVALAEKLSLSRSKKIASFEKKVKVLLTNLSMPKAKIKVAMTTMDGFRIHGSDQVNFLFSANSGMPFQDLSKVASGGELSRVMLAIKSILADRSDLPLLIFDEIDTGISGKVSSKVAQMMHTMSKARQVFAITHQAQVASLGDWHYKVSKSEKGKRTLTHVVMLSDTERINEVAEMLSGNTLTEHSIANATELLSQDAG